MAKPKRRTFSKEFKAHAVAKYIDNGRQIRPTAAALDIHPDSLRHWVREYEKNPDSQKVPAPVVREEQDQFLEQARTLQQACYDTALRKAPEASFRDAMTGYGISTDKIRQHELAQRPNDNGPQLTVNLNVHELMGAWLEKMTASAEERVVDAEIIDAEHRQLNAGDSEE